MKIGKLRSKLKDKRFVEKHHTRLSAQAERWDNFKVFECDSFFEGEIRATYNKRRYEKRMQRIDRQTQFIQRMIDLHGH